MSAVLDPSPTPTLTFLFTDLEGSTRLWQQFPEAMKEALARHDEVLRAAVMGAGGQVVKTTGDGIHAVFRSVREAVEACVQAQLGLLAESWGEVGSIKVRMGLHAGEAQQRGGDYYGTAVNRAARLMSAGHGGQVLLSGAAARLLTEPLPAGVSLHDLGEHRLKDLLRPVHVYQLQHPDLPADFPPIVSLNQLPNNLPAQATVFVGRQHELTDINSLLTAERVRLLTLTGPGGTGKTRLALQSVADLSDSFRDGAYFIDLAPVRDPGAVPALIARTIGLSERSNGALLDELKGQLREKRMLLLLDNFEQVTPAAVQVAELLQHCPRLKLLATSREALRVRGEHLYPVPPLGLPKLNGRRAAPAELARAEAVQLFVERARAVKPGFELTEENAGAIAELCLRLDGLPLAIELAAARIRLFSPQALQQRLSSRLTLLRGGARDLPERQQTLRGTIEWSHELLSEPEKRLFAVVSVFSGCTFEAVEAVAAGIDPLMYDGLDSVEGLSSLVDKSLVRLVESADDGEPRLRMLETIREYAGERLEAEPALQQAARAAHAAYFADFAGRQRQRLVGRERETALTEMTADVENLQSAWRYWARAGDLAQLQRMVDGLWMLYDGRGWYQATVTLTGDLLQALAGAPESPEPARQEIMLQTSLARALLALKGYTPEVEAAYKRALELSDGLGEIPQQFPVLRGLSSYYIYRVEFEKAAAIGQRILQLAESANDDHMRLHAYVVLGAATGFNVGLRQGLEYLEKGVALCYTETQRAQPYQLGPHPGVVCHTASAAMRWWLGDEARARTLAGRAMEMAERLNHPYTMIYTLFHKGVLHLWWQELEKALELAQRLLEVAAAHEYTLWASLATTLAGAAESALGRHEQGLERGVALYRGHVSPPIFWPDITMMRATAYERAGRTAEALSLLRELLGDYEAGLDLRRSPDMAVTLANLLTPESPGLAADYFRQALESGQAMGHRVVAREAERGLARLGPG